jgi:hypothetical protein
MWVTEHAVGSFPPERAFWSGGLLHFLSIRLARRAAKKWKKKNEPYIYPNDNAVG